MTPKNKIDANLIFDVGLHKGEDSDYYLKKGFRVVAFEANPTLVEYCQNKFEKELKSGQLTIISGAIVDLKTRKDQSKTVNFYQNDLISVWGTVDADWAKRNKNSWAGSTVIKVPAVDFAQCLKKYGVPYYMKIDIEGMDTLCLKALKDFDQKPAYVSIESEKISFGKFVEDLNLLVELGYGTFQAVDQGLVDQQREPNPSREKKFIGYHFSTDSSGLFGADLPKFWKSYKEIIDIYQHIFIHYAFYGDHSLINRCLITKVLKKGLSLILGRPLPGWHDLHARHSSV